MLPLEDLGTTPRERQLLRRVGLLGVALVAGISLGVGTMAWGSARVAVVDAKVAVVDAKIQGHLDEMKGTRALMEAYVNEERAARCAMGRNVYALCRASPRVACEPVEARCEQGRR